MRHRLLTALMTCTLGAVCQTLEAATCQVPSSSHPTIQDAIDDPSCSELVLAAQTFTESLLIDRDLTVDGAGSTETRIEGQVEVSNGTVLLQQIQVSSPTGAATEALWTHSGARVSGFDLVVVNGGTVPLFADGFESGDTAAWSFASP